MLHDLRTTVAFPKLQTLHNEGIEFRSQPAIHFIPSEGRLKASLHSILVTLNSYP